MPAVLSRTRARLRRLTLPIVITLGLVASGTIAMLAGTATPALATSVGTNDYPWGSYDGPGSDPSTFTWYNPAGTSYFSVLGFAYRNCTDCAAYEINEQMGGSTTNIEFQWANIESNGNGNADGWKQGAIINFGANSVNTTPAVGSVAWWGDASWNDGYGHVAIVQSVGYNSDGSVNNIVVADYNSGSDGNWGDYATHTLTPSGGGYFPWPDDFLHLADVSSAGSGSPTTLPSHNELAWYDGTTLWGFNASGATAESVTGYSTPGWADAGQYDLNGSETGGIFWYDPNTTSIYFIVGPTFQNAVLVRGPGVGAPVWAGVGDFTGDSYDDSIAWYDGTNLYLFAGSGLSTIWQTAGYSTPSWAGVGDYNHDGKDDLYWYLSGTGTIYVLTSTGSGFDGAQAVRDPGIGAPVWAGVGDFSGDGYRDALAWYDGTTLWTFEGAGLVTTGSATGYGAPQWAGVGECAGGNIDGLFWYEGSTIYCISSNGQTFTGASTWRGPGIGAPVWAGAGNFGF